ncbi:sterile alpha motif domain-containing protein 9-like [Arapaima gigas]
MSDVTNLPADIEVWTKEDVRQWLLNDLKVPKEHADRLYDEETSGASLVCFEKQDLLDLGVKQGPAIQIIKNVRRLKDSCKGVKTLAKKDNTPKAHKLQSSAEINKDAVNATANVQEEQVCVHASEGRSTEKSSSEDVRSETKGAASADNSGKRKEEEWKAEKRMCPSRPFDTGGKWYTYRQNDILPPETGPGNLLDPVHEYKLLTNTEDASEAEILKKFTDEVFRFGAACMNRRTNGRIHFGVGDKPLYEHGEIIGLRVPEPQKFIDKFYQQLEKHFAEETDAARSCIRPPQFIQVQHPNDTTSDKFVIEIDVIPDMCYTQGKLFYTFMDTVDEKGKQCRARCLFVREGASSINILACKNERQRFEKMNNVRDYLKVWEAARQARDSNISHEPRKNHQGHRLKQLIAPGRNTLDNSFHYIVVTNKCDQDQLENLQFLVVIRPFVVMDFDPESEVNGSCWFFRKDHIVNLHYPRMFNTSDNIATVIGNLNLFRQTSWVFCNGRLKEEGDCEPLQSSAWLKTRAGEVNDMITFLCKSGVLQTSKLLVVFLLHSFVTDMSSPLLETFSTIYQKLKGTENIVCICKDSSVFSSWRDLVQHRLQTDITDKCIHELSLQEINATIMKMKELQRQSCRRYLPSSGSSSVLLTEKDQELMTVLDILCENECEDTEIENSDLFKTFKKQTEEEFYRGGKVTWWNFYLSEGPGCVPFIKRDKFDDLCNLITPQEGYRTPCVIINLFHHPGCGGTTLSCGKEEQSNYTPVLLLVDDWDDIEDLQRSILTAVHEKRKHDCLMVIILNCIRSQFPKESSSKSRIDNVYITNNLSHKEQRFFQEKLRELKGEHEKPETFYAFMIMSNNFSEKYIENLVGNVLKDVDVSSKEGQLLSFLALLNTYVNSSSMSLSLCEELVGIKNALWQRETLEDKMDPYFTLFTCFKAEDYGTYQAVRFLHQMIAKHCLKVITTKHGVILSEILTNLLHCDLLYKSGIGKDVLTQNILSMLITRHRKELGDDKDTLFSPLVEQIQEMEGTEPIKAVLIEATKRFDKNATVPQALARHFYLKEKDFESALLWAQDAQHKMNNSYIADTLGQVYKSHLKHDIESAKDQEKPLSPGDLEKYIKLATEATKAFKESQELAKKDEYDDCLDQRKKRRLRTYNTSGNIGSMDVAMIIFDVLRDIPFVDETEGLSEHSVLQFLNNKFPASAFRANGNQTNEEFIAVLKNHEKFLVSLKPQVKEGFEFFEEYFTYLKPRSIERETAEDRSKRKISEHFKKYVKLFCPSREEMASERSSKPNLSLQQVIEDARRYLEEKRADTFSGLLQCLNEKNANQMEIILQKWKLITQNSKSKRLSEQTNFILANIVLHCLKPKSKHVKKYEELLSLLNLILQEGGTYSSCTELYYMSMMLLWPSRDVNENMTTCKNICTYVSSIKKSFNRRFSYMCHAKSPTSHFYLGKSKGLRRIIHKGKLDQSLDKDESTKLHLWMSGAVWREKEVEKLLDRVKGTTENGEIYLRYPGNLKIPVRPVYLGGIRSGGSIENVSFYLGFSMDGPVAYDIKYLNDM